MIEFFEKLYFNPKFYHYIVAVILLPLSFFYGLVGFIKSLFAKPKDFRVKIVSVGNLVVGGSGKTPFAIELIDYFSKKYKGKIFYISRGYGRYSKGLVEVKYNGEILVDVGLSGDEAMLVAKNTDANVIVSEDRADAIELAKVKGANLIILDDAFSRVDIDKFDILLYPEKIPNRFVLPSGPFREFAFAKRRADLIIKEGVDFNRVVEYKNLSSKMLLVVAIANANRLKRYLPDGVVGEYILKDHSYFDKDDIVENMKRVGAKTILTTQKDMVKLEKFNLPLSLMELKLDINRDKIKRVEEYYES